MYSSHRKAIDWIGKISFASCCCWDIDSLHMPSHMRCLTWRFAPFTLTSVHKSVGLMDRELSQSKSGGFRSSTIEAKQKCCKISNFKTVTNGTCIVLVICVLYFFNIVNVSRYLKNPFVTSRCYCCPLIWMECRLQLHGYLKYLDDARSRKNVSKSRHRIATQCVVLCCGGNSKNFHNPPQRRVFHIFIISFTPNHRCTAWGTMTEGKKGKKYFLLSTFFSSNHQWYLHNLIKISLTRFGWKIE